MDLNQDTVPVTLNQAVDVVFKALTPTEIREIKAHDTAIFLHHTIGQQLRDEWSLWNDEIPCRYYFKKTYEINHPDDISTIVLECVAQKVKGEEVDPQPTINLCHHHWMTTIGKIMP